ncbi:MAG: hypothetical protein WC645_01410 [Candidatus Margulisiibacteriota bacterium]
MSDDLRQTFLSYFDIESNGFEHPVQNTNRILGFSAQKKYSEYLLKKLGVDKDAPFICLIHIYVADNDYQSRDKMPLYCMAYFCHQKDGVFCQGVDHLKKTIFFHPVTVELTNDFFFNKSTCDFFYHNNKISPHDILQIIFDLHIKPTRPFYGFPLRLHIMVSALISGLFYLLKMMCVFMNKLISGEEYNYDFYYNYLFEDKVRSEPSTDNLAIHDKNMMDFFGFKAKIYPLFVYAFIHLVFYLIIYVLHVFDTPVYISNIFHNIFLTAIYAIVTLYIWINVLPIILKYLIKYFETQRFWFKLKY